MELNWSNMTNEEVLKYGSATMIKERFEELLEHMVSEESALKQCERHVEVLEEQVYFARETLDILEHTVMAGSRIKDVKKDFKINLENSMFER